MLHVQISPHLCNSLSRNCDYLQFSCKNFLWFWEWLNHKNHFEKGLTIRLASIAVTNEFWNFPASFCSMCIKYSLISTFFAFHWEYLNILGTRGHKKFQSKPFPKNKKLILKQDFFIPQNAFTKTSFCWRVEMSKITSTSKFQVWSLTHFNYFILSLDIF